MSRLRLILGDQLNINHSWFRERGADAADIIYVLMEIRSETDYVVHHAQKVLGIFAAMRGFANALRAAGFHVHYIRLGDADNQHHFINNLRELVNRFGISAIERQQADEYRVESLLLGASSELGIPVSCVDSEHFLADREKIAKKYADKIPRMEFFYRELRKQYRILLDENNQPIGGQWNFDQENRNRWKGDPAIPEWYALSADLTDIWQEIQSCGVHTMGDAQAANFPWPITRAQAKAWLKHFVENGLPNFGEFQDAMTTQSPRLFHAGISFALNIKLLHPLEVIHAALAEYEAGRVSISTVEGFVRQILGWREFVRAVYWARMPHYAELNELQHHRRLPRWYWDADTKMNCLHHAISQSLDGAYAHHIQRLMVTGNFALLAGCAPDEVDAWYLGIYIDAFEWVEMPNTRGMSQYADGGLVGSKPYAGSASYINKMSDYCKGCHYNHKRRHGEGACPFNSLYWHFHVRHAQRLARNPRIGMTYKLWGKMSEQEQTLTLTQAEIYLKKLDNL
ncbi:cryptochrome/photolyase family protein [Cellvibrio sp.]|uniref:cryptochrome/photolyase family protein n=1 Tax=Cellvibrio sp. TaxID=1965322 RepID=UPI003964748D